MFYYFDKTTRRCIFTCSAPIGLQEAIRVESAGGFSQYPLGSLYLSDNNEVTLDEEKYNQILLETEKTPYINTIDSLLKDIEGYEKYDGVDVSETRETLNRLRHNAVKATALPLEPIPNISDGIIVVEEEVPDTTHLPEEIQETEFEAIINEEFIDEQPDI